MARLDRWYCFKHHFNTIKGCTILPVAFSDHCLVKCDIFINNVKSKSAYWHFNTNLLSDNSFCDTFKFFWNNFKGTKASYVSLQQWWDVGKVQIQQLCRTHTLNASRDISQSVEVIENEILDLQHSLVFGKDQERVKDLKRKNKILDDLLSIRAQGALVRSRFQCAAHLDSPTKFFFGLEKRNGLNRFMHSLLSESGKEITESKEIRKEAVAFYEELYKGEQVVEEETASCFYEGLPQVPEGVNGELVKPFTKEELYNALNSMKCGKAPGIDGIPVEFYKAFWAVVGDDLFDVLNDSLSRGLLPLSCRRAVITLIPKKGDLRNIKNWRPVSLLCSDFKVLSKALAIRLREAIGWIVHVDQTYCVPDRSIFDNIHLIRGILELSRALDFNVGLISLDQEKAFDRVEHRHLSQTLRGFGFDTVFIKMIGTLYRSIESMIKINGGLSAPFKITRGIRQGCALSGMLYALAIEPLLIKIREKIDGWSIPRCDFKIKISAYADDIVVLVNIKKRWMF